MLKNEQSNSHLSQDHVLMQGVPDGLDVNSVRDAITTHPGVTEVHDLHVWALGSKEPVLTAHVVLDDKADPEQLRRSLSTLLEDRFDVHESTLQIERESCGTESGHK